MGYVRQHYGLATTGRPTQQVGGSGSAPAKSAEKGRSSPPLPSRRSGTERKK